MNLASASPVKAKTLTACSLCGLTTLHPLSNDNGDVFCCPSCREVAALLAESPAVEQNQTQVSERSESVVLSLGGMWCSSCAWLVSEQLRRTNGVVEADVSFIQGQANLTFDSAITNPKNLKSACVHLDTKLRFQMKNRTTRKNLFSHVY
ncbi:MAG: cation transporter [Anaerolineales bacterium]|nr:cation transporter [Anaerolineales bacterium]